MPSNLYHYADNKQLGYQISVNGEAVQGELKKGYLTIERKWKKGDVLRIHFDMEPRLVQAHQQVAADRGHLAIERGPIVYCAEWPDNDFNFFHFVLNRDPKLKVIENHSLFTEAESQKKQSLKCISAEGRVLSFDANGRLQSQDAALKLIPYFAWAHRGPGNMMVWIPNEIEHAI